MHEMKAMQSSCTHICKLLLSFVFHALLEHETFFHKKICKMC